MNLDRDTCVQALAHIGRSYHILVHGTGATVTDFGPQDKPRTGRPTNFRFDLEGKYLGSDRRFKAAWLMVRAAMKPHTLIHER